MNAIQASNAPAQHRLVAEVPEVGDGAAEGGQPELEKGTEDLARATGPLFCFVS
jgi:hypothetical protein